MVSTTGYMLGQNRLITGFGARHHHYHHHRLHHGGNIARRTVGSVVRTLGHALTDRIASAISGTGSWKLAGTGRHNKRAPRSTLSGGYRRVHRRRTVGIGHRHRHIGLGYHRRVGRPRKPRSTLSGGYRRVHHRHRIPLF